MHQRLLFLVTVMVAVLVAGGLSPQDVSESPERLAAAAEAFAEARAACEADASQLWGRPLWGPFMIVDPATRRFVASEAIEAGAAGDAAPTIPAPVGEQVVHVGALPENVPIANTASDYAGRRWAMALWPIPDTPEARRQLLCHELWHRVQEDLGMAVATPPCDHLDEEQGRLWLRLEMRALAVALRAPEPPARRQAINDAMLFRWQRHALFDGAADAEHKLELAEGLAEYTGLRLSGRADQTAWAAENLDAAQARESLVRSFPYATGPAYGLLLDEVAADWRWRLNADSNLAAMLQTAMGRSGGPGRNGQNLLVQVDEALPRYDGAEVRKEETQRAQAREARRRELTARLVDGVVLEVPMKDGRVSFNPRNVVPLPPHGTVYPGATLTGAWGKLEAPESEVLIATDWQRAAVSAVEEPQVEQNGRIVRGRGWMLRLEEGWQVQRTGEGWRVREAGDQPTPD